MVGGGFGGLQAVRKLRHAPVDITLIDRRNFHLFQPLVYQVATGALSPSEIASPLRGIFKRDEKMGIYMKLYNLGADDTTHKPDGQVQYVLVNDVDALLYLVNQGTITFHPFLSRVGSLDTPDYVLFDVDPHQSTFANAVKVAKELTVTGSRPEKLMLWPPTPMVPEPATPAVGK